MASTTNCTIGPDIKITGRLSGDEDVNVQGTVEGTISLNSRLSIEKDGRVVADVEVDSIAVHGYLEGEVVARELVQLLPGCTVTGNIRAPRIKIEDGARFRGNIDMDVAMPDAS